MSAVIAFPESLAEAIEREHLAATRDARSAMEHAIRCGVLLLEAKASLAHGEWLPWIAANLSFGDRQARKYLSLAKHAEAIRNSDSDFTIEGALALLRRGAHPLGSGSCEFYTPTCFLDGARQVMGTIDLDPASCAAAQQRVCPNNGTDASG
jgi:Protein of unknown function (DUF3102)